MKYIAALIVIGLIAASCYLMLSNRRSAAAAAQKKLADSALHLPDSTHGNFVDTSHGAVSTNKNSTGSNNTVDLSNAVDSINRDSLVSFAKQLMGTPYLYGSMDPAKGFDCSGFIFYVFNHFKILVPRSSYDMAKVGIETTLTKCKIGDLILFTGTDPQERNIGHVGIVIENTGDKQFFIHSSSGKANGVTITPMQNQFYQDRLMMVVDVISKKEGE